MRRALERGSHLPRQLAARRPPSKSYVSQSKTTSAQPIDLPKLDSSTTTPPVPSSSTSTSKGTLQGSPPSQSAHTHRIPVPTSNAAATEDRGQQLLTITLRTKALDIDGPGYGIERASFPYVWLRDVCQGKESVEGGSRQKLFRFEDVDEHIKPLDVRVDEQAHTLTIHWDRGLKGRPKRGDVSTYDLDFLRAHSSYENWRKRYRQDDLEEYRPWDCPSLERKLMEIPYDKMDNPAVTDAAIRTLLQDGLAVFKDVPVDEQSPDKCSLISLASKLGRIMPTWYGEKCFSVRTFAEAKNIAYTSLPLDLHMDLLHFHSPPRYQLLHCLHLDPTLEGGASYFVDAYKAAEILRRKDRQAFDLLATEKVGFEYKNDGHWTYAERPTFEFSQEDPTRLTAVNYAPPFQAPFRLYPASPSPSPSPTSSPPSSTAAPASDADPTERIRRIHEALSKYSAILNDPKLRYERQLKIGECVVFDNRRVLHARTGFRAGKEAKGEIRLLMGCYLDETSVADRFRVLQDEIREEEGSIRAVEQ